MDIIQLEELIKTTPERSEKLRHACDALQDIENADFSASAERVQYINTLRIASVLFDSLGLEKTAFRFNRLGIALGQLGEGVSDPLLERERGYSHISTPIWVARAAIIAGVEVFIRKGKKNLVNAILDRPEFSDLKKVLCIKDMKGVVEWRNELNRADCKQPTAIFEVLANLRAAINDGEAKGRSAEDLALSSFRKSKDFLLKYGLLPAA
jgi:hypothetical protein